MDKRLETLKYTFTVEGETEKWYFDWLQDIINLCPDRKFNVSIDSKVQQSPLKFAKGANPKSTPNVVHICDIESEDAVHVEKFKKILSELKDSKKQKNISYKLGYSNFTFELWIILHKKNCTGPLNHRSQYLSHINQIFNEKFENLDQYKHEDNFKRCLKKLSLSDVKGAIDKADALMQQNKNDHKKYEIYKGYKYYKENPSLTIYQAVESILSECGICKKKKTL